MTDLTANSDDELLRLSTAGDQEAFVMLYRRLHGGIYRFALHMSGRATVAEEVVQEVFLTVIRDGHHFDPSRGTSTAYLYGIARNNVLRTIHRDRAYVSVNDDIHLQAVCPAETSLSGLTRAETIEAVRQAVLTLPEVYREAVVLCDLEEMSYVDAAGAMGVPVGTVRSRLNRGRNLLVQKLKSATRCFV